LCEAYPPPDSRLGLLDQMMVDISAFRVPALILLHGNVVTSKSPLPVFSLLRYVPPSPKTHLVQIFFASLAFLPLFLFLPKSFPLQTNSSCVLLGCRGGSRDNCQASFLFAAPGPPTFVPTKSSVEKSPPRSLGRTCISERGYQFILTPMPLNLISFLFLPLILQPPYFPSVFCCGWGWGTGTFFRTRLDFFSFFPPPLLAANPPPSHLVSPLSQYECLNA